MKSTLIVFASLAAALAAGTVTAAAADAQPTVKPLRPVSACLDVNRINEWYVTSDRSLIVRAGPNHYRVDLKAACPRLGASNAARLVPSGTPGLAHRLCGDIGEQVVTGDGLPCAVQSVTPIDAANFKGAEDAALATRHAH